MRLLGIDIGTSGTKTVLFDEQGQVLAAYTGEYPLSQPHNGWAEQDPEDWWDTCCKAVKKAVEKYDGVFSIQQDINQFCVSVTFSEHI